MKMTHANEVRSQNAVLVFTSKDPGPGDWNKLSGIQIFHTDLVGPDEGDPEGCSKEKYGSN